MRKILFPALLVVMAGLGLFIAHSIYWLRLGDGRAEVSVNKIYLTAKDAKDLLAGNLTTVHNAQFEISPTLKQLVKKKGLTFTTSREYYLYTEVQVTRLRGTFPTVETVIDTLQPTSIAFDSH